MRQILLALLLALAALAPAGAKTLVYCSEGEPSTLNPQFATTTTTMNAGRPIFDTLVGLEPGSLRPVPSLAESWTISEDGLVYTFRLRAGVRFHEREGFRPTRPLDARDVVFSLERPWKRDHPFHASRAGTFDYFTDIGLPDLLDTIEAVDRSTVRIRIRRPDATFLAVLGLPFNVVLSAEYAEALLRAGRPDDLDEKPVGTGPFAFEGYQAGIAVRYRAFEGYWGGRQPLDLLVFSVTPNPAVRLTKLRAGECHVAAYPNPTELGRIAADPNLRLLSQEGLNVGYMALNATKPPFDDVRVRRAVNMAIDKSTMVAAVYGPAGTVAKNPIPPILWGYNEAVADYPFDPDAAARLLAEAGLATGFESELWYMPVSRPYNPNGKRIAEMLASDLARLGIRLTLRTSDWNDYRTKLQAGEAPMALFGWTGDIGDPDNFLDVLLGCTSARVGGNNVAKWCDRDYDALVTRAKRTGDRAEREGLYAEAQVIAKREAPWVPLAHSLVFMATRKEVQGFRMDLLGRVFFDGVDLAP